jgi:F-type H+-transporting ATPase subunit b
MLIDWFTVGAQVLNFLILVWLMKRFLYQPILNAIDARETKIAVTLADADAKQTEAQQERDTFNEKNDTFDHERAAMLAKATDEADVERQRLLEGARAAADSLTAKRQQALDNSAEQLNQAIARQTQEAVFSISRKALADLATTELEERVSDRFIRRLRALDEPTRTAMCTALTTASEPTRISSAFTLPEDQRNLIQNAINETFSASIPLEFKTAPDLISGIELSASGQKIAWSIADYLTSLQNEVGELLKPKNETKSKATRKPQAKETTETTLATQ